MNVEKMRAIGQAILAEPRRFNMDMWGESIEAAIEFAGHARSARPPCGTVCCFAGEWAILYGGVAPNRLRGSLVDTSNGAHRVNSLAQNDLDMPNDKLFFTSEWPDNLQPKASMKPGTKRYAEHFVNVVLESYIQTNGWAETGPAEGDA